MIGQWPPDGHEIASNRATVQEPRVLRLLIVKDVYRRSEKSYWRPGEGLTRREKGVAIGLLLGLLFGGRLGASGKALLVSDIRAEDAIPDVEARSVVTSLKREVRERVEGSKSG